MNLYGFAGGDPVNFADPFGLTPDWAKLLTALYAAASNWAFPGREAQSNFMQAIEHADVIETVAEKSEQLTRGMKVLVKPVAAGGKPNLLKGAAEVGLSSATARGIAAATGEVLGGILMIAIPETANSVCASTPKCPSREVRRASPSPDGKP